MNLKLAFICDLSFRIWQFCVIVTLFILLNEPRDRLYAQETIPREVSPSELVTLDRSLPISTALDILSQYSLKYDGKIIIDSIKKNAPIGVMVNNMYWKRALEYILRSNLMKYEERERYYEVVPLTESQTQSQEGLLTPRTREVEINAVFFDADYATLAEAGIDWTAMRNGRVIVNGNFASEVTRDLFNVEVSDRYQSWDVFALLRTFESLNKGEVIANPQIKVMDGEEGKIKVGTNFFLTTRDFAGNTRFTEYEAGIILTVTPEVIIARDTTFIHLDIQAERSNVNPDPVAVTKATTESSTQVLLLNGEETVMAGMFSHETASTRRGIPILKDLPPWFFGLRYLFGYESKQVKKKELIIILQASVLPTIAERMTMRMEQKNYIQQKRLEFQRKMRQLKTSTYGTNGRTYQKRRR